MASDVNQWTPGVTRPGYYPRAPSACVETRMVENPNYDPVVSLLTVGLHSTMLGARKGGEVIIQAVIIACELPDTEFAFSLVFGFDPIGDIPKSGCGGLQRIVRQRTMCIAWTTRRGMTVWNGTLRPRPLESPH